MKFIISKTALEMAVKNICRVINPKNALPILADILCMVDEERKTITAYLVRLSVFGWRLLFLHITGSGLSVPSWNTDPSPVSSHVPDMP